jgi:hypothetical protein
MGILNIVLEWTTSIITVIWMWLIGTKWKYAPVLGIIVELLWVVLCLLIRKWGLFACTFVLLIINIRNAYLWAKEDRNSKLNRIKRVQKDFSYASNILCIQANLLKEIKNWDGETPQYIQDEIDTLYGAIELFEREKNKK